MILVLVEAARNIKNVAENNIITNSNEKLNSLEFFNILEVKFIY